MTVKKRYQKKMKPINNSSSSLCNNALWSSGFTVIMLSEGNRETMSLYDLSNIPIPMTDFTNPKHDGMKKNFHSGMQQYNSWPKTDSSETQYESEQDITDQMDVDMTDPPPLWGGLPISQKDVFSFTINKDAAGNGIGGIENYPDQYAHFSKPFIVDKNRAQVNRTRNTATIYRRN